MVRGESKEPAAGPLTTAAGRIGAVFGHGSWRPAAAVLAMAAGIGLLLGGVQYNRASGFHHYVRPIEGEVTIVPTLPFAFRLEKFGSEEHRPGSGDGDRLQSATLEPQTSVLALLHQGRVLSRKTVVPRRTVKAQGVSLRASSTDAGWAFALVVRDPGGREKVVPVTPWSPALVHLGLTRQYVSTGEIRSLGTEQPNQNASAAKAVEIFLVEKGGKKQSLGFATATKPVSASGYMVSIWNMRPFIGLDIYRRPGRNMIIAGCISLLAGLAVLTVLFQRHRRQ